MELHYSNLNASKQCICLHLCENIEGWKWWISTVNKLPQSNLLLVSKQDIRDLGWLIRSCYSVVFSTYGEHTAKYSTKSWTSWQCSDLSPDNVGHIASPALGGWEIEWLYSRCIITHTLISLAIRRFCKFFKRKSEFLKWYSRIAQKCMVPHQGINVAFLHILLLIGCMWSCR